MRQGFITHAEPTDGRWAEEIRLSVLAKDSPAVLEARSRGLRVDPDGGLCAAQLRHASAGYVLAEVDWNIYGWCVRDTMNDGRGRMSPNLFTREDAIAWAHKWHAVDPTSREVIERESAVESFGRFLSGDSEAAKNLRYVINAATAAGAL